MPVAELLEEVIKLVTPDAEHLECLHEVTRCREIVRSGTSSDRQLEEFERASRTGSHQDALQRVCAWIAETTVEHARTYRSEERRVGKECSLPCRSRWSPYH